MDRSEALASVVHCRWNARQGAALPEWYEQRLRASGATEHEIEGALRAAAELSGRWQRVQVGHGLSVDWPWPERGRSDPTKSGRKGRSERRSELAREA